VPKRSVEEFLETFVVPFVCGGDIHVANPIDANQLRRFEDNLAHASVPVVAVDEARTTVISELVVRPPHFVFDEEELRLAVAVHNLLFMAHPQTEGFFVTKRALAKVAMFTRECAAQPLTKQPRRVLARHGLLHNLFDLTRRDQLVSWWLGKETFLGQSPPQRLMRWGGLRRVRTETSVADYDELFATAEMGPVINALMKRSPLTNMLCRHHAAPPLNWEDVAFTLRDVDLARALSYASLKGESPAERVLIPSRFAHAFEQLLTRRPATADIRAVAAFLVHLNTLFAVEESTLTSDSRRSPLLNAVLAPERAGQRSRGLATFFALPNALAVAEPPLAEPPGLQHDPQVYSRWRQHRAQVADGVGSAVIETLANRVRQHLSPLEAADNPG